MSGPLRRNAPGLAEVVGRSLAGVVAVHRRRKAIVRETLGELGTVAKLMRLVGARESMAHLDGLALGWVNLWIESMRELAMLATTTQRDALAGRARHVLGQHRAA